MRFVKSSWRLVDWWRMEASFWAGAMGPRICWRRARRARRLGRGWGEGLVGVGGVG
jgi:hypothetical protein